jgi:hypothetical protein
MMQVYICLEHTHCIVQPSAPVQSPGHALCTLVSPDLARRPLMQELFVLEDVIGDYVELKTEMAGRVVTEQTMHVAPSISFAQAAKVHKLAALASAIPSDAAFARQLRKRIL